MSKESTLNVLIVIKDYYAAEIWDGINFVKSRSLNYLHIYVMLENATQK